MTFHPASRSAASSVMRRYGSSCVASCSRAILPISSYGSHQIPSIPLASCSCAPILYPNHRSAAGVGSSQAICAPAVAAIHKALSSTRHFSSKSTLEEYEERMLRKSHQMRQQSQEERENYEQSCTRLKTILKTASNRIEGSVDSCSHSVNNGCRAAKEGIKSGIIMPLWNAGGRFRRSYITRPRKYVTDGLSRRAKGFAVSVGADPNRLDWRSHNWFVRNCDAVGSVDGKYCGTGHKCFGKRPEKMPEYVIGGKKRRQGR